MRNLVEPMDIVKVINDVVWSPALVVLLVGAGLYFTIRTRCVQLRKVGMMARLLFSGVKSGGEPDGKSDGRYSLSSFQAFCLALSGRVGTGNIVGVATAIAFGGPGAVFWMWVTAFLGASTAFTESTLSQMYRFPHDKGFRGGPACYIEQGLGQRWLGIVFAVLSVVGYGSLLAMVQSNGISSAFHNSFSVQPLITGLLLAVLLGLVLIGGLKRIANVAAIVTPFMAIGYILMSVIIICVNYSKVPGVFAMIVGNAFAINPLVGGIIGSTISMGVRRGLFSNEAGQGSGAIVSASALVDMPAKQGLVQAFSVYVDTLLVCTSTALMILSSDTYNIFDFNSHEMLYSGTAALGDNYVSYTQAAIDGVFVGFGEKFVTVALLFFVFTTLMAYYFYSESSIIYLFWCKKKSDSRMMAVALRIYQCLTLLVVVVGACTTSELAWTLGDIGIGVMAWVNVVALLLLFPKAKKALADLERQSSRKDKS